MPACPICLEELPEGATACPEHGCPADPLIGAVLADAYRIGRPIGQGAMGRVYLGEDVRLGRQVAVKVMMPGPEEQERTFQRFQREARAIAALGHQHIVTVFDIGQIGDGQVYLVMEFMDGETLDERVRREGTLDPITTAGIVAQVARAIGVAHKAGMVHRDLKPENVMLIRRDERDDFVKVLDFGLAKPVDASAARESMVTQLGVALGTPAFMSPEQGRGEDLDHRSDIYALGMLAYHMLCGRPAFEGPPPMVMIAQVMEQPPSPRTFRPDLSEATEAVVLRCLKKKRERRYQTADEAAIASAESVAGNTAQMQALMTPYATGSLPAMDAVPTPAPLAPPPAEPAAPSATTEVNARVGAERKVLAVDDSGTIRRFVSWHLTQAGFEVIEATNGQEGVELAVMKRPDLILLDVTMPVMDGVQALRLIRSLPGTKDTPVVMLTAESRPDLILQVVRLGISDYINKPFTEGDLLEKVRTALDLAG